MSDHIAHHHPPCGAFSCERSSPTPIHISAIGRWPSSQAHPKPIPKSCRSATVFSCQAWQTLDLRVEDARPGGAVCVDLTRYTWGFPYLSTIPISSWMFHPCHARDLHGRSVGNASGDRPFLILSFPDWPYSQYQHFGTSLTMLAHLRCIQPCSPWVIRKRKK